MGYVLARKVMHSALPRPLREVALVVAELVRDPEVSGNRVTCELFISVERLAYFLNCHPVNARLQRRALQRAGYLEVLEEGGGRRRYGKNVVGIRTRYRFRYDLLPQREPVVEPVVETVEEEQEETV